MSDLKRRQILQLAAATLLRGAELKAAFLTRARERLVVSTYPFRSVMEGGTILQQFTHAIRPKLGVRGKPALNRLMYTRQNAETTDGKRGKLSSSTDINKRDIHRRCRKCSSNGHTYRANGRGPRATTDISGSECAVRLDLRRRFLQFRYQDRQ